MSRSDLNRRKFLFFVQVREQPGHIAVPVEREELHVHAVSCRVVVLGMYLARIGFH